MTNRYAFTSRRLCKREEQKTAWLAGMVIVTGTLISELYTGSVATGRQRPEPVHQYSRIASS